MGRIIMGRRFKITATLVRNDAQSYWSVYDTKLDRCVSEQFDTKEKAMARATEFESRERTIRS